MVVILLGLLLMFGCGQPNPYNIQADGFARITLPLSLSKEDNTTYIPHGSTIYHLEGMTEVYRSDGELLFRARDSDVVSYPAPGGPTLVTHILQIPDGALISDEGENITRVYVDEVCILTVIDMEESE